MWRNRSYQPIRQLGQGYQSTVWLAKDLQSQKLVAIKATDLSCLESQKSLDHLRHEQKSLEFLARELNRSSASDTISLYQFPTSCLRIVKLLKVFYETHNIMNLHMSAEGTVYFVFDFIPGAPLNKHIAITNGLPEDLVRFYAAELIRVIGALHERGFVYRDLKASNLIVQPNGRLMLIDFGFAKHIGPRGRTRSYCGTLHAMPPEVLIKGRRKSSLLSPSSAGGDTMSEAPSCVLSTAMKALQEEAPQDIQDKDQDENYPECGSKLSFDHQSVVSLDYYDNGPMQIDDLRHSFHQQVSQKTPVIDENVVDLDSPLTADVGFSTTSRLDVHDLSSYEIDDHQGFGSIDHKLEHQNDQKNFPSGSVFSRGLSSLRNWSTSAINVLEALSHSNSWVYRGLKPTKENSSGNVLQPGGVGTAPRKTTDTPLRPLSMHRGQYTSLSTPNFGNHDAVGLKLLLHPTDCYGVEVDWWSLGVITYEMLFGYNRGWNERAAVENSFCPDCFCVVSSVIHPSAIMTIQLIGRTVAPVFAPLQLNFCIFSCQTIEQLAGKSPASLIFPRTPQLSDSCKLFITDLLQGEDIPMTTNDVVLHDVIDSSDPLR